MAWIGLIDESTGAVTPATHAGREEGYLACIAISVGRQPAGRGPTGSALLGGSLDVCDDIRSDPRMEPWRDAALQRGYRASAAVPFRLRGRIIGALNLYSEEAGFFADEERKLLEEIGVDISYALDAIEEEADRRRIEGDLRRSETRYRELVENVPIWIWETDSTLRHVYTNSFVTDCLGYQPDEFLRRATLDLIHPDDHKAVMNAGRRALTEQRGWSGLILRWKHENGTWRYIESRGGPKVDAEGNVTGLHGVDQDITQRMEAVDALRDSEEKFRNLVELATDWIWEINAEGVYTYVSPKVTDILGYLPEEIIGKTPFNLMSPDEAKRVSDIFTGLSASRNPISLLENINLHKDGHAMVLETSCVPLFDAQGAFRGYQGIDRDITERKRSEALLRDSEEKYRAIVENTSEWIWEMDLTGRFTFSNTAVQKMLGYTPEELSRISSMDLIDKDEKSGVLERLQRHVQDRTGWTGWVLRWRHKNGEYRWLDCDAAPILDAQGAVAGFRGSDRDITERKNTEERLAESERKYRNLFDAATDAIFILDRDGNFLDVNSAAYTRLGYTKEEMLSMHVSQVDTPEHAVRVGDRMAEIQKQGQVVFEAVHKKKDGSVMPVEVSARMLDHGGQKVYFSVIRDITERRKAEEEKLELERRLLHAQKLESLGVLAGGIAHDFNNLLMAILGNLDMALVKLSPLSTARENIEQALQATHRSADLTRQMLAYSGKGMFVVRRMDLSELVEENAHLLRASIAKNVTLKFELQRPLRAVEADPAQLQQVVMNLITNSSEAIGDQPGVIRLSTGVAACTDAELRRSRTDEVPSAGTYAFLEVADTGCGMSEDTLQRLFDPFFTTKAMGRGLGMSAILGIVRGHQGAIMVDSVVGRGTTIRVLLPVALSEAAAAPSAPDTARTGVPAEGYRGTVLVVDDEEIVRNVSREMLAALGLTVLTAEDGEQAIETFRREGGRIDCVLLDLSMPKMDGMAVCRDMLKLRPDAKIILSSGYHEQELIRRGSQEGFAGFIPKPYTLEAIEAALAPVLKKGA
jgi:two-component system cell cycle sensor histidine kinase/response regulator CckA